MRGVALLAVTAAFAACGLRVVGSGGDASDSGSSTATTSAAAGVDGAAVPATPASASSTPGPGPSGPPNPPPPPPPPPDPHECPSAAPAGYDGCCGSLRCAGPKCPDQCSACGGCTVGKEYCCTHPTGPAACMALGARC